jgi:hypothetical protein
MDAFERENGTGREDSEGLAQPYPAQAMTNIREDMMAAGGPYEPPADCEGCVGFTMFDRETSEDDTLLVLLPRENIGKLPSQSVVRIVSREDKRVYLGVVVGGPFALPDGLRADAPPIVATAIRGGFFLPEYHGLVVVEIAGEEKSGQTHPHRLRPRPNSPVFVLQPEEVQTFLHTEGNISLGDAFGYENLPIRFSAASKETLPRHTGILGTTGGGKSTTVAHLISQLQAAGAAVILLDTEGEYTEIDQPTDDPKMLSILQEQGREPAGIPDTDLYFLIGRETSNPQHPRRKAFSPRFEDISPYVAQDIFDLNEAQEERFLKALDVTIRALDEIVWNEDDRRLVKEGLDEFDTGYPKMRLSDLYDVVRATADTLDAGSGKATLTVKSPNFGGNEKKLAELLDITVKNVSSWRKLQGKIGRVERLQIFDNPTASPLNYTRMLQPGRVSIIDLSDTDSTLVNNLIISDLLRGVQKAQDDAYTGAMNQERPVTPVVVIIEEAHEFLSAKRISRMPTLHQQVERIAKRGRKRWLGLCFVTQLPQHLPDEILGLVNNFILHKIGDSNVIARLKRSIGGVDESLWNRLPRLAPGQAVVALTSLARPMLTAMCPAACRLRMVR